MKYVIVIGDGMADYRIASLGNKTPLEVAKKPRMDYMARHGIIGFVHNVPKDMIPESDTANLAVMGYDPKVYSKGRSPLEAVSMGIDMKPDETAFRINTVALTEDADSYEHQRILDHGADEIPTEESTKLIETLQKELGDEIHTYYPGVSYRHCLIWKNAPALCEFTRPHDILGREIGEYLPQGEIGKPYREIMEKSFEILKNHPVNLDRKKRGLLPANSLWIWGPGKKPQLTSFEERFGKKAAVISAVDLIKGIGLCAGMEVIEVEGAGNIKKMYPGATTIFVLPPDMQELERRLRCRGTEDEETIQRRLKRAEAEIANSVNYDEHVVNIEVDSCAESIYSIIQFKLQHGSDE